MRLLGFILFLVITVVIAAEFICEDESAECAKMNSLIGICDNKHKAKKICKKYCNLCNIIDGNWSPWCPWAKCNVTCGKGYQLRSRKCDNPAPQNGGLDCEGNSTELTTCDMPVCPVHGGWTSWENWGKCSSTCGVGMRSRTRSCTNPRPQLFGDHCYGNNIEDELCNSVSCSVDGGWTYWSNWGACSVSCGVGLQSRFRSCTNPSPINAGNQCTGQNIDVKLCEQDLCNGNYTAWKPWSNCVGSCGGVQTRERTCLKSMFSECLENTTETRTCGECYSDCYDIGQNIDNPRSGLYHIKLWKSQRIKPVYCDFDTDSGGWTVFQYRFNGTVDFFRDFADYYRGFGSLNGEFWLGLDNIYEMVSQGKSELRLDLTSTDGKKTAYETFQNFRLDEGPSYTLQIDKGVGTAGDSGRGLSRHNGQKFSTYDNDQDNYGSGNCAASYHGGWWYINCFNVNLNGKYSEHTKYRSFNNDKPLKVTRMMFRRV